MPRKDVILAKFLPAVTLVMAGALLAFVWGTHLPEGAIPPRLPMIDAEAAGNDSAASPFESATLTRSGAVAADLPGEWPCFRGARRDAISDDGTALAEAWPADGPKALWSVDAGEGYAGAAVSGGRVYLMDYDQEARRDALRCLSLADGGEIWRFSYPVEVKRNHGMSRTVPAVSGGLVVGFGPKCHVTCLNAETGEFQWGIDLVRDHGSTVPLWYAGQCPLIDGDRVILAPAGRSLVMAVDLKSGEILWESPNPNGWKMTHVSVTPMEIAGRKTYIYCGHRGVAGIAADDGSLLWETPDWRISIATVSSPVPVPGDRIFLSGGYEAGSMMLQVSENNNTWKVETLFKLDAETFGATQQTPVLFEDHIYGIRPNGELVCLDLDGKVRWTSGMNHRFGLGPLMIGDGKILALDDHGLLTMARAVPESFEPLAQAKVLDGHDAWGPMALVTGRLIVRDLTRMVCLDLTKP
jgi:outer membrane protein assembly factor BamB